ncbi:hypothetical protein L7F22_064500 [Adiantum nelumboides]|nr:hypothetical protein [Adiantum nelumboides]
MTFAGLFMRAALGALKQQRKVTILGAAGGIVQPLALLMKLKPLVSSLSLYDIANTLGVATAFNHVNTRAEAVGCAVDDKLGEVLKGIDVVIIPAGLPQKPGMTRNNFFNINASIVKSLCTAIAKHCLEVVINMISNPFNSTDPISAEVFNKANTYDHLAISTHLGVKDELVHIDEEKRAFDLTTRMRKEFLVPLQNALEMPEIYMSAEKWSELPDERVPSGAMTNYVGHFASKKKVSACALLPHMVANEAVPGKGKPQGILAKAQWKHMWLEMLIVFCTAIACREPKLMSVP